MPLLLVIGALTAGGVYYWGKQSATTPDPVQSLTNLLIVGSVVFVGYKIYKRG